MGRILQKKATYNGSAGCDRAQAVFSLNPVILPPPACVEVRIPVVGVCIPTCADAGGAALFRNVPPCGGSGIGNTSGSGVAVVAPRLAAASLCHRRIDSEPFPPVAAATG